MDRLIADGWQGAGVARSDDTLAAIRARGALAVGADATVPAQLAGAFAQATNEFGRVDLVVNAVSVAKYDPNVPWGGGDLLDADLERYQAWSANVTLEGFVFLSEAARFLKGQDEPATIVQVTNRSSREAAPGSGLWAAGWHGVRALTHAAAAELREHGIHVALLVVDGPIESPKTQGIIANMPREAVNDQSEIAAAVAYMAGQGDRGRSNELVLTPAGRAPTLW